LEFWPHYLREHYLPRTRYLHYVGTGLTVLVVIAAIAFGEPVWLWAMPVVGYSFAWAAHALVERNKPATFTYPLWSLISDYKMSALALVGGLTPHLERAGVARNGH
jgi:hypothetical protein